MPALMAIERAAPWYQLLDINLTARRTGFFRRVGFFDFALDDFFRMAFGIDAPELQPPARSTMFSGRFAIFRPRTLRPRVGCYQGTGGLGRWEGVAEAGFFAAGGDGWRAD
jgi:hypothetical protein